MTSRHGHCNEKKAIHVRAGNIFKLNRGTRKHKEMTPKQNKMQRWKITGKKKKQLKKQCEKAK